MTFARPAYFIAIGVIFVINLGLVGGFCPAYGPSYERLLPPSGSYTYTGNSPTDKCQWSFPIFKIKDHVVVIKFTSLALYERGCLASIRLAGMSSFCRKPTNSCYIYASQPACDLDLTYNLVRDENCSESTWVFDKETIRYLRFIPRPNQRRQKSFSFEYNYIPCVQDLQTLNGSLDLQTFNGSLEARPNASATMDNSTIVAAESTVPSGTFAGVVVVLILLLLAALGLAFWIYKKLERAKASAKVPRVQYEFAQPQHDHTVLECSYATVNHEDPSLPGNLSQLHGEHQQLNGNHSLNGATNLENAYAEYSLNAKLGDETLRDDFSFTSDESEEKIKNETPYATLNKSTMKKKDENV